MTLRPFKYGYGLVLGEINVIEEEAEHVREIFDNYIAGKSLSEISNEFLLPSHVDLLLARTWGLTLPSPPNSTNSLENTSL